MSLLCRLKNLVHKGVLKEKDLERIVIIPKEQEPCEDCISRQSAQARIKNICNEYRLSYEDGERKAATGGSAYALGHAFDDLPPVTPKPKTDVLDKIRAEIEQNAYPIVHGVNNHEKGMTLYGILQIIERYKAESEE